MKTMMMITIVVLMTMTMAKSDENVKIKDTPKTPKDEIVKQVNLLKDHLKNEWVDIKEYQANARIEGKEQNARNWAKIKSLFTKVKDNVTQD